MAHIVNKAWFVLVQRQQEDRAEELRGEGTQERSGLTNDIGQQQGQGHCDGSGTQSCALPVAAPVGFVKGEGRSGKGASRERPRRWRVNSVGG